MTTQKQTFSQVTALSLQPYKCNARNKDIKKTLVMAAFPSSKNALISLFTSCKHPAINDILPQKIPIVFHKYKESDLHMESHFPFNNYNGWVDVYLTSENTTHYQCTTQFEISIDKNDIYCSTVNKTIYPDTKNALTIIQYKTIHSHTIRNVLTCIINGMSFCVPFTITTTSILQEFKHPGNCAFILNGNLFSNALRLTCHNNKQTKDTFILETTKDKHTFAAISTKTEPMQDITEITTILNEMNNLCDLEFYSVKYTLACILKSLVIFSIFKIPDAQISTEIYSHGTVILKNTYIGQHIYISFVPSRIKLYP